MAKKKNDNPPRTWIAGNDPEGGIFVELPEAIRTNCEVLRWLYHWLVDAIADRGHDKWMVDDIQERFGHLGANMVGNSIADLIRQAQGAVQKTRESKQPKEPEPSKKPAKPGEK